MGGLVTESNRADYLKRHTKVEDFNLIEAAVYEEIGIVWEIIFDF